MLTILEQDTPQLIQAEVAPRMFRNPPQELEMGMPVTRTLGRVEGDSESEGSEGDVGWDVTRNTREDDRVSISPDQALCTLPRFSEKKRKGGMDT